MKRKEKDRPILRPRQLVCRTAMARTAGPRKAPAAVFFSARRPLLPLRMDVRHTRVRNTPPLMIDMRNHENRNDIRTAVAYQLLFCHSCSGKTNGHEPPHDEPEQSWSDSAATLRRRRRRNNNGRHRRTLAPQNHGPYCFCSFSLLLLFFTTSRARPLGIWPRFVRNGNPTVHRNPWP
jgi:hypothetical protein